jgi:hypothetical protein
MKLVIKNKFYEGRIDKDIHARITIAENGDQKIPWTKVPYGYKEETLKRIIKNLEWRVVSIRSITLVAEIPDEVGLILRGIFNDTSFDEVWEKVKDMKFKRFLGSLYSYYSAKLLKES